MSMRVCVVEWCSKQTRHKTGSPYCGQHYHEKLRKGRIRGLEERPPRTMHGFGNNHPLYGIWSNMRSRCFNPSNKRYSDYGGRGITVCPEWIDFSVFVSDMGEKPPGCTLERIDNNKGYQPDNCRWATAYEQTTNQRIRKDNSTGYKWVSKVTGVTPRPYTVNISHYGVLINMGRYSDPEEAAYIADQIAMGLRGEDTLTNFTGDNTLDKTEFVDKS